MSKENLFTKFFPKSNQNDSSNKHLKEIASNLTTIEEILAKRNNSNSNITPVKTRKRYEGFVENITSEGLDKNDKGIVTPS